MLFGRNMSRNMLICSLILLMNAIIKFQIRIAAYDSAFPDTRSMENVLVTVVRNPSAPSFEQPSYTTSITESFPPGENIFQVMASDPDGV